MLSLLIISVLGIATGVGAAYLIVLLSPATAERISAPINTVVSAITGAGTGKPVAEASSNRPPASRNFPIAPGSDGELGALLQRGERELAEHKLELPSGDNALQSYRQLSAKWPADKRVAQLGGAIGLAFWSLGSAAQAAGDWNKALHCFEIVNSLPPLPLGAPPPQAPAAAQ